MPGKIGNYVIGRTLGEGATCKTKIGTNKTTGEKVAVKIIHDKIMNNKTMSNIIDQEMEVMRKLTHNSNIVKMIDCGEGEYIRTSGKTKNVKYIVMEIAQGGEMFDFIAQTGALSEDMGRYFFKQMLNGLDHCHLSGLCHRDLKLENILLNDQFDLKIADFGFACPVDGTDGREFCTTKLGTPAYMAPEIHLRKPYSGRSVDLFAAAIVLFNMVAGHPPFETATARDAYFKCLAVNRADIFWKSHTKNKSVNFFSDGFKDLIQSMLQLDASHRPSLNEVFAHEWMKEPTPAKVQVISEFDKRLDSIKAAKKSEIIDVTPENLDKNIVQRSNKLIIVENIEYEIKKNKRLEEYEPLAAPMTQIFSVYHPDIIEKKLLHFLQEMKIEAVVSDQKYKMKFNIFDTAMVVRILKLKDEIYCIEFKKESGLEINFHKSYQMILHDALKFANNIIY